MKPRSDSKLKLLPRERQEQIIEWCKKGYSEARAQLAADGTRVSLRALSEFYSWYQLNERFSQADSTAKQVEELLRQKDPNMDPAKIQELGQALFTIEAMKARDTKTFLDLESLRLAKDSARTKAEIDRERVAIAKQRLLLDKARQQLVRIAEQGLTEANKDGVQALLTELEALGVK